LTASSIGERDLIGCMGSWWVAVSPREVKKGAWHLSFHVSALSPPALFPPVQSAKASFLVAHQPLTHSSSRYLRHPCQHRSFSPVPLLSPTCLLLRFLRLKLLCRPMPLASSASSPPPNKIWRCAVAKRLDAIFAAAAVTNNAVNRTKPEMEPIPAFFLVVQIETS